MKLLNQATLLLFQTKIGSARERGEETVCKTQHAITSSSFLIITLHQSELSILGLLSKMEFWPLMLHDDDDFICFNLCLQPSLRHSSYFLWWLSRIEDKPCFKNLLQLAESSSSFLSMEKPRLPHQICP